MQRINLTTALGTSLVNTLFVLDEPSIGLHSRDIRRLIGVLHRLRDAGNTLLVVEHDPEVIRAADLVLDMGPGPGARGRRSGVLRRPPRPAAGERVADGRLSHGPQARGPRPPRRGGACARPRGQERRPGDRGHRRERPQPPRHRREHPAGAPRVHHRGQRIGQVDAGAGRAVLRDAQAQAPADRAAGQPPGAARGRAGRRRRAGRPVADRPHDALQPRQLRRRL